MTKIILTIDYGDRVETETYTKENTIPCVVCDVTDMDWSDVETVKQAEVTGKALIDWFNDTRRPGATKRTFVSAAIEV